MKNLTFENDIAIGESLLADLAARDAGALERLYHEYCPTLRAVAFRVLHDELDTEDVLQEIFTVVWQRADGYSPERGRALGWLITLARRRAIDRLRQRSAYRRATERFEAEAQHSHRHESGPRLAEATVSEDELRGIVEGALARLPVAQRTVVEHAFFAGMSQREIASALCLPLGTVKTRIELGLRKLAGILAGSRCKIF